MKKLLVLALGLAVCSASETVTKETKQLTVSMSANTGGPAKGPVMLTLTIDLKPKMHVYAPGVKHYIPIDWQMADSPAMKAQPVMWPKAETLHLDAIDETVPVYTGQLRAQRKIELTPAAHATDVTVKGTLRYQACDDRMCYIPASVPLEWTFHNK